MNHIKKYTYDIFRVAVVWLALAAPALAQSPADCPRRWLETAAAEGTYLGRDCPNVCYLIGG